jgi:hypothetical protein
VQLLRHKIELKEPIMKMPTSRFVILPLTIAACICFLAGRPNRLAPVRAAPQAPNSCAFPTMPAATPEQTAWQLFVAANCQANPTQLVWETWVEQLQLYPASGTTAAGQPVKRLHGSPLAAARSAKAGGGLPQLAPTQECNQMKAPPPNVIPKATICEEVHINDVTRTFLTTYNYQIRSGQIAAAQKGTDIEFPTASVEIKVDWVPASDFNPPFSCATPPAGVHVETIEGACYAMAGMHISSKLLKDWLWATFEPQSMLTNPLRCITFGPCTDAWGSVPATSNGGASGFTKQSPALAAMMKAANLAPVFLNYRLDGVQTTFTNPSGTPTLLGNSVIEGENVGMKKGTASCITCHSVSTINKQGTDGIRLINNQVGPEFKPPAGYIARDFVWSMALACPAGIQNCTASAPTGGKKKK